LNGGDSPEERLRQRQEFMAKFSRACSEGFDPDRHLTSIGIANQTTMLKGETEQIGKLFEHTMLKKYPPDQLNDHFLSFNTICDATQERQDAMFDLVKEKLDLMVVIGGYNSSNTTHLQEIAVERSIPSYHIDSGDRILSHNRVEHKPLHQVLQVQENWLPEGEIVVGVTSGASTPDKVVATVIERIFEEKGAMAIV
jgi:4-hydroxy-3-methylbut-2-en-1-yl diphosphate reductase